MNAYKCDIGMVFVRYGCECVASAHQNVRNVDRNFRRGKRTDVRALAFCLADLDIYAVSLAPISMATCFVGTLATKSHVLYWSTDYIRPIEHCTMLIAAHCVAMFALAAVAAAVALVVVVAIAVAPEAVTNCRWNNSSTKIALVSVSNRPMMRTMVPAPRAIAANCIRPVSLAIGISASIHSIDCVHIGSFLGSDACRGTLMWVCNCHSWWAASK